jgi:hypothetical protein
MWLVLSCCFPTENVASSLLVTNIYTYGTQGRRSAKVLWLFMILKTLEVLGPLHGYGIARRIEQISGDVLAVNQGTLYPALLRLEPGRRYRIRVGSLREQSPGLFLPAHAGRPRAAPGRNPRLGANRRHYRSFLPG